ncbi:hypothetical protein AVEN_267243-1, partial [Araneus ventricosus]
EILNHLPPSVTGTLYVDDLQISCQGCNMRLIERQLQNAINKIVSWCDENGHALSAEKNRTSLLRIYQAVVLSRIDYGCLVYGSATSAALRRLDTVHHSALRICSGAFRTSPVESLYTICHQLPLHLRRKKLSLQYYFRSLSHSQHPTSHMTLPAALRRIYNARPSHILPFCERVKSIIQDSELNFPDIQTVDFQIFPPWNIPQFSFINPFSGFDKNKTSPVIYQQLFSFHRYRYSSYRPIFTDGSKAVGHVGCGIFDADISSFRLHTSFSILTAELVAIFYALQKISLSTRRQFCIYTDSMSSLEALCHPHFQMHPVAMEILGLLQTLQHRGFCILFCWIPSHVGIAGNEQADHSAKTAASLLHREIPYCDVKKSVTRRIFSLWQETWDLQVRNKLHYIKPFIGLWPVLPTRGADVKLTRLRIGHTRVTHKIWHEHCFPPSWQQAIIIPIPKPGKDPSNPLNYRPIALTNCLCKLMEKMVNRRLVYYLEHNKDLSPFQSGFRTGRCNIDNLLALEMDIRTTFLKRQHLVAIFFDIEKAYDRIWSYGILQVLFKCNLRGNLPIFIQNFLRSRQFRQLIA